MKVPAVKFGNDATFLAVAIVGLVVVYYIGKQVLAAADTAAKDTLTGNNALTQGTPYQGYGVAGDLGAAANDVSGGLLGSIGGWLGDQAANIHDYFAAPTPATSVDSSGGGQ